MTNQTFYIHSVSYKVTGACVRRPESNNDNNYVEIIVRYPGSVMAVCA